ncbi:MAG TPA: alpha/beta fold hydrolase [Pseudonocardia sp.]|nr:alpha/beta fold hydrolase [Pseudonocardia sp.]
MSGTLLLPPGGWDGEGDRPVVSYAVGTHGLGDRCAPSVQLRNGTEQELRLMQQALRRGWAVVVTDYEGLGTPGPHPYAVALSEAHAVLDAVRAAVVVPGADLSVAAPVGIWGYSQGGGAVAAAAEQAGTYAPELDIRGVAAGGVPADLAEVFAANARNRIATGLIAAATTGFDAAYPELRLRERLTPTGQRLYDDVRDDCVEQIVAKGLPFTAEQLSADADPLAGARGRLAENSVGATAPAFPALVYHGGADELIPVEQGRDLRDGWCALGVDVRYREFPLGTHIGTAAVAGSSAVGFLAERFSGVDAPSDCA